MKKLLAIIMFGCLASTALADNIRIPDNLTQEQIADLQLKAAEQAKSNAVPKPEIPATPPPSTAHRVKEWVEIGSAVGSGLASSAKELGVAANDFANTPVGKMTAFLIAWHFLGPTILHYAVAMIWIFITLPVWIYMYRRQFFRRRITYFEKGKREDGAKKVVEMDSVLEKYEGTAVCFWITLIFILVSSLVLFCVA